MDLTVVLQHSESIFPPDKHAVGRASREGAQNEKRTPAFKVVILPNS